MKHFALLILMALMGCATKPAPRPIVHFPPNPAARYSVESARATARSKVTAFGSELPKLRGCAWDYYAVVQGITFEVWASTNLVNWVLATNTTEWIALFPEKQMEFYRVRARDELGQLSDWATTAGSP